MDRIGEYLVRRLIGEGGMGKVFEAEERLSKRRVALKVLRPELARSEEGRRLFLNEMTILAHLDHPNVVRCLSCSEVDGELVMALEFLEGRTLRELIVSRGRLPWPEAVGIIAQIAAALQAAHAQSPAIIHRDLKPENVIVLPDGMRVKVTDFGIAKVLEAMARSTTHSVGTLQYMSPEQIDAAPLDARADLYALGLVFYELLCGRPPFESASPRELLNMHCTATPPAMPDDVRATVPKGIERLVYALLRKRPDERPSSAADVLAQLEPFAVADLSVRTEVPGVTQPAPIATAKRPVETQRSADTIALIERAAAPRNLPTPLAVVLIVVLSLVAGGITYGVRTVLRDDAKTSESR
jgi:serine/threonine protein kinase